MRILSLFGVALALPLIACNDPAKVCVEDETLTTARSLLLEHLIGDPTGIDVPLVQRAFDEVVTFELVRFEGEDESTKTIRCRAQVKSPHSRGLAEIVYVRQPDLGADGYVYTMTLSPEADAAWAPIAIDVVARTRMLESEGRTAARGPQTAAPALSQPEDTLPDSRGETLSSGEPRFLNLELEGSDGVRLAKFQEWADEREGGDVNWRNGGAGVSMRLTWRYDDGRQTLVETTFEPSAAGQVRLGATRQDGKLLSAQEAQELIDGVLLDMYHRGMTGP